MKKLFFLLAMTPSLAWPGSLTVYQTQGGDIGSVVMTTANKIFFDSSTTSGWVDSVSPVNWTHTVGTGSNRFLVVGCGTGGAPETISSATVGGFAMTLSTSNYDATGTLLRTALFTYASPPSGAQGITVYTGTGVSNRTLCMAVSFTGVNQDDPIDVSTGTRRYPSGGVQSVTFTTTHLRDVIVDVVDQAGVGSLTAAAGQASQYASDTDAVYFSIGISTKAAELPGSYTMSWTPSDGVHIQTAIALKVAP